MEQRTLVTFRSSAFNTREEREYFINPGNYGDDVARWIVDRLSHLGLDVGKEPGQEDFGWYVNFRVDEQPFSFVLGYRPSDGDQTGHWIGWVENDVGFIRSLFGARSNSVSPTGSSAIHRILSNAPEVSDVKWHGRPDFDAGNESAGKSKP